MTAKFGGSSNLSTNYFFMTKNDEIKAISTFANSLPADTYLKPWLVSLLPEIERELTSDFIPSFSLAERKKQCDEMTSAATERAAEIISRAEKQAAEIISRAERRAQTASNNSISALQSALRAFGASAY
jgi:hypothetical protein